jgi:DNA-binding CsgD family transcriptional regulator
VHVDPNSPRAELTKRQQEVLERLERGDNVKQIATDIGVSRNAVYQHIERLRRQGAVAETYTPSGQPPRRAELVGSVALAAATVAPRESAVARLRELARAGDAGDHAYAEAIEGAIAAGDAVGLAYELGRLDALGERGLPSDLVEAALRRLAVLPSDSDARE